MQKNIALVCNPTTANAKAVRMSDEVSLQLKKRSVSHLAFHNYWPAGFENFSDVWIFGGDGTLNYFINKYPHIKLPLSIFPAGSGNDFHWMLYGELSLVDQINKVLEENNIPVDAGRCNENLFLNGVGIGFDGAIVKDLLGKTKMAGKATYLFSVMKHIISYSEKQCNISYNNEQVDQQCFMISVANGKRYGGGFCVTPKANCTDGLLDINIVGKIPSLTRMRYLPTIEEGGHLELPFVRYAQAPEITIKAEAELHAHLDGEYFSSENFSIQCLSNRFVFSV